MSLVNFSPNSSKLALSKPRETPLQQLSNKPVQAGSVNISKAERDPNISTTEANQSSSNRREQVESRASNTLLNASQKVSSRKNAIEGLEKTLSSIGSLITELKNETNPNRQESIKSEIQTLVNDAKSSFAKASERDPNIRDNTTFSVLTKKPDEGNDTQKFSSVNVAGVPSPEDLGIESLDLSDLEESEQTVSNARQVLKQKSNELDSNASEIGIVVREKRNSLSAEAPENPEESAKNLADAIKTSAQFFVQDNEPKNDAVSALVLENQKEAKAEFAGGKPTASEEAR
ncbi:MAG TPA: hypothetical protein PKA63_05420 [Oligoflexia bacterium]|nr:hypothetical protein [Oligoflexia bacterium]HMP48088.1 hypothetical protein [Oligoflexia bacterium]